MQSYASREVEGGAVPDVDHVLASSPHGLRRFVRALVVARRIGESLSAEAGDPRTADGICTLLGATVACLYRLDPASESLVPVIASTGVDASFVRDLVMLRWFGWPIRRPSPSGTPGCTTTRPSVCAKPRRCSR